MRRYRRGTQYLIGRESQRVDFQHLLMDAVSVGEPGDRRCVCPYQQGCSAAGEFARQDSVEIEARRVAVYFRLRPKVFGQITRVFRLPGVQGDWVHREENLLGQRWNMSMNIHVENRSSSDQRRGQ